MLASMYTYKYWAVFSFFSKALNGVVAISWNQLQIVPNVSTLMYVLGGWPATRSVEIYHNDFTHWTTLPDMIEDRAAHTQSGLYACGGSEMETGFTLIV